MASIRLNDIISGQSIKAAGAYVSSLSNAVAYVRVRRKWAERLGAVELDEEQSLQVLEELNTVADELYNKWSGPMVGNLKAPYVSISDVFATVRRAIDEAEAEARAEEEQGRCM